MDDAAPGMGHNLPPLAEILPIETAALAARAAELVAQAGRCSITDDESAGRATALFVAMRDLVKEIDEARKLRQKPFDEMVSTVRRHFAGIWAPLAAFEGQKLVGGAMHQVEQLVDAWRIIKDQAELDAAQERAAEAERAREGAATAQEQAQAADQSFEQQIAAQQAIVAEAYRSVLAATNADESLRATRRHKTAQAELMRLQEAAQAEVVDRQVAARRAEETAAQAAAKAKPKRGTIRSEYGTSASGRKVATVTLSTDKAEQRKAVAAAFKFNPTKVLDAVQAIYEAQVRAGTDPKLLPGATVTVTSKTVMRKS